jgi:hypothetical protein
MESTLKGNKLSLAVDLEPGKLSSTGKSTIRYSSGGFQPIPGGNGLKVNITVIEKK